jgi:hypothetical protein
VSVGSFARQVKATLDSIAEASEAPTAEAV